MMNFIGMQNQNSDWIKQYIDLMRANNPEQGIPLKDKHFPNRFYKYCSLNDYTFENLENEQLWLSKIEDLNDPFECGMMFDQFASARLFLRSDTFRDNFERKRGIRISEDDLGTMVSSDNPYKAYLAFCEAKGIAMNQTYETFHGKILGRWKEIRRESNEMLRVCCFTTQNDNILMWSHYANSHIGICIEYDFSHWEKVRFILQPIYYTPDVFQISTFEDLTAVTNIMASLYKSPEWSYETEWRVTGFPDKKGVTPETIKVPSPTAIYLGIRFDKNPQNVQDRILNLTKRRGIPVYEMVQAPGSNRISVKSHES
jgi:hypothetical protein